jgi:hypothetical protein
MNDKPSSTLNRLMNRQGESASSASVRDAFQEGRTRSRDSVMLDVRFATGNIESFNYAYLTRISYKPGDTLRLQFGGSAVKVEGKRLSRLRDSVSEHRARYIQEGTDAEEGLKPEDAAHIDSIVIEDKGDEQP